MSPEQHSFEFGENKGELVPGSELNNEARAPKTPDTPSYSFAEKERDCLVCHMQIESIGACNACKNDPEKLAWLKKNGEKINTIQ